MHFNNNNNNNNNNNGTPLAFSTIYITTHLDSSIMHLCSTIATRLHNTSSLCHRDLTLGGRGGGGGWGLDDLRGPHVIPCQNIVQLYSTPQHNWTLTFDSTPLYSTTQLHSTITTQLNLTLLYSTPPNSTTQLYSTITTQLNLTWLDSTRLDSTTQLYTITTQLDLIRLDYSRVDSTLPDSTPLDSTNTYTGLFPTLTRLDWTQLDSTTKLYTITT